MVRAQPSASPHSVLPWLADLVPDPAPPVVVREIGATPALALAAVTQQVGCRRDLAGDLGCGETLGVDMVHTAVNRLLAAGALPQLAALHVLAPADTDLPVAITAGIARACRAHELPIQVPLAAAGGQREQIGLVLTGAVVATPSSARDVGDVVLALRARGPSDADFVTMQARARELGLGLGDRLAQGDTVGATLLAAQSSQLSVLQQPLRERWPACLLAVHERSLVATLRCFLPAHLDVEWTLEGWQPPAPFGEWFPGVDGAHRAAATSSFGCSMLVVVAAAGVARWLELCAAWNEAATPIGRLVAVLGDG